MTKTAQSTALSPLALASGRVIESRHALTVHEAQNDARCNRIGTLFSFSATSNTATIAPGGVPYTNAPRETVFRGMLFIDPDIVELTWTLRKTTAGGPLTIYVDVGFGSTSVVNSSNAEETKTFDTSVTGTGWQPLELQLEDTGGGSSRLEHFAIRPNKIAPAVLGDPI